MHTYVSDSTATTRKLKKCFVSDSGGTSRYVKKIWVSDSGGVSRLVFTSTSVFTMVAAAFTVGPGVTLVGYSVPDSFGSLSPHADVIGNTVSAIFWEARVSGISYQLAVASNVGQAYFTTFAVAGQGSLASAAATYSYSAATGLAIWGWSTAISFTAGNTYTISVSL
jgi:hypothetical protein